MSTQLPQQLLDSLEGTKGFDKEAFQRVHDSGEQVTSIRFNPLKCGSRPDTLADTLVCVPTSRTAPGIHEKIPWAELGYYLKERPSFTFDPLFHAGCYYVQEASSMFLEQALKQTVNLARPIKVLDLSAAPGGKSTHIQSLISADSLLVSNDVIRSRANVLKDNIIKWGALNVAVTHNDPRDIGKLENYFDLIVVDAPCSGSGLFRRDPGAIAEWSENNVQLCSQRQQRILADIWPALKNDGMLIYSTCSYSKEEDEDIVEWLEKNFPVVYLPLSVHKKWGITVNDKGYRFWPDKTRGEGFFIAVLKKKGSGAWHSFPKKAKPDLASKEERELLSEWVKEETMELIKHENTVYAWPQKLFTDLSFLLENLRVIYSGTRIGELIRDKLVPDHALAMSPLLRESVPRVECSLEKAIDFLQRRELKIETPQKGWQVLSYQGFTLGWINALPNRINNYYPRELRILKDN